MSHKPRSKYKAFAFKRKRSYYLETGLAGFLCTCNSKLKERDCVREAYNVLNEFADKLFGPESTAAANDGKDPEKDPTEKDSDGDNEDIGDLLKKEVESIKEEINQKPEFKRFQVVQSHANGIVFIRTTVPDPVKLAHTIVKSSADIQKTKFLLRLLPVEITCKAYVDEICNACDTLFDKYFTEENKTFAIIYNHRHNNSINREELIEKIAGLVVTKNNNNKADLKHPQLAVLIEVIRNICCISVVPEFYTLKKYNLLELAAPNNEGEVQQDVEQEQQTPTEEV